MGSRSHLLINAGLELWQEHRLRHLEATIEIVFNVQVCTFGRWFRFIVFRLFWILRRERRWTTHFTFSRCNYLYSWRRMDGRLKIYSNLVCSANVLSRHYLRMEIRETFPFEIDTPWTRHVFRRQFLRSTELCASWWCPLWPVSVFVRNLLWISPAIDICAVFAAMNQINITISTTSIWNNWTCSASSMAAASRLIGCGTMPIRYISSNFPRRVLRRSVKPRHTFCIRIAATKPSVGFVPSGLPFSFKWRISFMNCALKFHDKHFTINNRTFCFFLGKYEITLTAIAPGELAHAFE